MKFKICKKCRVVKELSQFLERKPNTGKYNLRCRLCLNEWARQRYQETKEIKKFQQKVRRLQNPDQHRLAMIKHVYGISKETYLNMYANQNFKCKICNLEESTIDPRTKKVKNLCVDHCHTTGKIRGLLCNRCNVGLSRFRDSVDILTKAIGYLNGQQEI